MARQNNGSSNKVTIDYIVGMPPSNATDATVLGRTNTVMENSMPLAMIYPGTPSFTKGLSLFTRSPAFRSDGGGKKNLSYSSLLDSHGYALSQPRFAGGSGKEGCLVLAYQADSFPTDSFSNDYGENFLQGVTNVASEAAASLSQMMGARSVGGAVDKMTANAQKSGGKTGKMADMFSKAKDTATDALKGFLPSSITGGVNLVSQLAAGGRIDFPMVWKSSSFQPSYTMTVRLYNPNPGNDESTQKYIAAPLAAIMLLAIPISTDGITYSWPFIHKIVSPGIYSLDPAFISNITVIKGGDQQQISFKQKLGIVDVRIDFGSLFSSMLAAHGLGRTRPTLETYLKAMVGPGSEKTGVENFSTTPGQFTYEEQMETTRNRRATESALITKNQAPLQEELTNEEKDNPPDRVSESAKSTEQALLDRTPEDFRGEFGL